MSENHEKLKAFFEQSLSRASLIEVLVHESHRLSDVIFGKVASVNPHGIELNVKGSAEVTISFDFSGADIRPHHREKPLERGWKVRLRSGETLVFLEIPQHQMAA